MVVLEHTRAGENPHFDWLIDQDGVSPLISFRTHTNPMDGPAEFNCVRTPDHRRAYLEFEGEISGGRGSVRRVARIVVECFESDDDGSSITVRARHAGSAITWRVRSQSDGPWLATRESER